MRTRSSLSIAAGVAVASLGLTVATGQAHASDTPPPEPTASTAPGTEPPRVVPAAGLELAASAPEPPPPAAVAATEIVGPPILPFTEGAVPEGYVLDEGSQVGVWVSGICTFVTSWAFGTFVAVVAEKPLMAVPLAGPFVDAGVDPDAAAPVRALVGGVELIGAGLFVTGLILDNPRFVRSDVAGVKLTPTLSATSVGTRLSVDF